MIPLLKPRCFFCDQAVKPTEAGLTDKGKVFGPCCDDLVRLRERVIVQREEAS